MAEGAENNPSVPVGRSLINQNVAAPAVILTCWRNYADLKRLARLHSIFPEGAYLTVPFMSLREQSEHSRMVTGGPKMAMYKPGREGDCSFISRDCKHW